MKHVIIFIFLGFVIGINSLYSQTEQERAKHVKVYYEKGMYGGWPANYGIWNWGNEILVGFSKRYYKDTGEHHHYDKDKDQFNVLARSLDGGETWKIEDPGKVNGALVVPNDKAHNGTERNDVPAPKIKDLNEEIDFEHPGFCLTVRAVKKNSVKSSRYWYSYDRGHNWEGPFALPNFGTPGLEARTDYLINGKRDCMLFLTAAKSNGDEGVPICIETNDGGMNWTFVSQIGPEPEGFSIMPASVRLSANEILVTIRRREGSKRFIAGYLSEDNGRTWHYLNNPVEDAGVGNPPAMVKMKDGRICLVYGYRGEPYSIRAKISNDNGRTWSKDYILRDDGSGGDMGYPRVVQRPDGKIVAVYYFMDKKTGPERYIAATVWDPPIYGKE